MWRGGFEERTNLDVAEHVALDGRKGNGAEDIYEEKKCQTSSSQNSNRQYRAGPN